jgi:hypothetical protein
MRTIVQPIPGYQLRWSEVDDEYDDEPMRGPASLPNWMVAPGMWLTLGGLAGWLLHYIVV